VSPILPHFSPARDAASTVCVRARVSRSENEGGGETNKPMTPAEWRNEELQLRLQSARVLYALGSFFLFSQLICTLYLRQCEKKCSGRFGEAEQLLVGVA
jgi:hypothetical protein